LNELIVMNYELYYGETQIDTAGRGSDFVDIGPGDDGTECVTACDYGESGDGYGTYQDYDLHSGDKASDPAELVEFSTDPETPSDDDLPQDDTYAFTPLPKMTGEQSAAPDLDGSGSLEGPPSEDGLPQSGGSEFGSSDSSSCVIPELPHHAVDSAELTPPPGFRYNPDILESYADQVRAAIAEAAYQAQPVPSFEDVPPLDDITPTFNPTGAADDEIYARGQVPRSLRPFRALRSEWTADEEPVEMWRIVERARLEDGTGITSSRVLVDGKLGDVEGFKPVRHLASNHESRLDVNGTTTPFISFSTDPVNLARDVILKHGFGVRGERNSVVICVRVDPDRVITGPVPGAHR
jgi:hypothetical protein